MRIDHAIEACPQRSTGDDRAALFETDPGVVVVLADGAGGTSGGARAAQAVLDAVQAAGPMAPAWTSLLDSIDERLSTGGGQTTAVIVQISNDRIVGASVGDSGAWLIADDSIEDLTSEQVRKPLLGAGALPIAFAAGPLATRTLLVASDGLLRYANRADIARVSRGPDLASAARQLIELVRLPSGGLQDDVSVVLCREVRT